MVVVEGQGCPEAHTLVFCDRERYLVLCANQLVILCRVMCVAVNLQTFSEAGWNGQGLCRDWSVSFLEVSCLPRTWGMDYPTQEFQVKVGG